MTKLEKVIKGLQLCRYDPDPGQECKFLVSCDICPYWEENVGCKEIDLFNDALELLKEQELKEPTQEAQRDYEAASDMRDYCERYEPTYNPDDGSM